MKTNTTITHKNRKFNVIEVTNISEYANVAKEQPSVESFFIAEGVKGSLISGYAMKNGTYIIF